MKKRCDHKSVGMLVWKNKEILLIERKRKPFGFAPPSGHVDENASYEEAAKQELREEVNLQIKKIKLVAEGKRNNSCRRIDGGWHYWKIYTVATDGEIKKKKDEVKQVGWYNKKNLNILAEKTEKYLQGEIQEKDWKKSPGLEVVWYNWFKKLRII